jgi:hypothetical protein
MALVMSSYLFNASTVDFLKHNGLESALGAIIVLDAKAPPFEAKGTLFSHDSPELSYFSTTGQPWNPYGNGLMHRTFSIPVVLVQDSEEIEVARTPRGRCSLRA